MNRSIITIELFGVPRARAGVPEIVVSASTVAQALGEVIQVHPKLADILKSDGSVAPQYLLSLNGQCFVADLSHPLQSGDRLLLLSADAGG